ncbi:MAG: MOSC N-terminal beta barrel domain-containing protein [Thermoleophilia bacterium]
MNACTVTTISYSPVKGLALSFHEEVELELAGVRDNRRFHLITDDGRLVNGKVAGKLVQVAATTDPDGTWLSLRFPDGAVLEGSVDQGAGVETDMWGRPVAGRLVEGAFSEAISTFAGRQLRLVRADEPGAGSDRGIEGSVSLVSSGTLDRLAGEAGKEKIDGRRFRMLFDITGVEAHEEDGWLGRSVAIGDAIVRLQEVVGRCAVTTQDPDTGVPDLDTLRILERYRPTGGEEPLPIGVWGRVEQPGRVRVGDLVVPLY